MTAIQCTTLSLLFEALICSERYLYFVLIFWDSEPNFPNILLSWVSIQRMNSGGEKMARDIAWPPWLKTQIALAG